MLKYKIKEMLEASGIEYPAKWLIKYCDFSETKAYKFVNNKQISISTKNLTTLCENLNCTPNDLYYWVDSGRTRLPENHPLVTKLSPPSKTNHWFKMLKHLPPEKVMEIHKIVQDELNK